MIRAWQLAGPGREGAGRGGYVYFFILERASHTPHHISNFHRLFLTPTPSLLILSVKMFSLESQVKLKFSARSYKPPLSLIRTFIHRSSLLLQPSFKIRIFSPAAQRRVPNIGVQTSQSHESALSLIPDGGTCTVRHRMRAQG